MVETWFDRQPHPFFRNRLNNKSGRVVTDGDGAICIVNPVATDDSGGSDSGGSDEGSDGDAEADDAEDDNEDAADENEDSGGDDDNAEEEFDEVAMEADIEMCWKKHE